MSACDTTPMTRPWSSTTGKALTLAFRIPTIISLNDAVFLTATTRVAITSLTQLFITDHLLAMPIVWRVRISPPQVNGPRRTRLMTPRTWDQSPFAARTRRGTVENTTMKLGICEVQNEEHHMGGTGRCRFPGIARGQG
jgi:hypothetical protein